MAYDASYDWAPSRFWRIRRWFLRLVALVALAGCGVGVWAIVRDATGPARAQPDLLVPELTAMAVTHGILADRLDKLRPGSSLDRVRSALSEARADAGAAQNALSARAKSGTAAQRDQLAAALKADRRYLHGVAVVVAHPGRPGANHLVRLAHAAKAAFVALPRPSGLQETFHGYRRLVAYARAARG